MISKNNNDSISDIVKRIVKYFPEGRELEFGWSILKMINFKRAKLKGADLKKILKAEVRQKHKEFKKKFRKSEFGTMHISDLYKKRFKNAQWIVESLVPFNGVTALSGEPGTYKSYLSLYIAKCVSGGLRLFDRFNTSKVNVLIMDEEEHDSILQKRAVQMKIDKQSGIFFRSLKGFKINNEEELNALLLFIKNKKIKLVIFDSFRRILKGNENDSEVVNEAHTGYKKMVAIGASVITLHHHRKTQQGYGMDNEPIRGSTDILAGVECHLLIKKKEPHLIIEQRKLRIAKAIDAFTIEVVGDDENIDFKYLGENINNTKSSYAEGIILSSLKESDLGSIKRKEMIKILKKNDIGTLSADKAIKELNIKSKIRLETGKNNSKTLYLIDEE